MVFGLGYRLSRWQDGAVTETPVSLDAAIDELYAMDPAGFVARRTALVKLARDAKNRELAQQLGALKKPTVVAWLLNVAARSSLTSLMELLRLVREVRTAEQSRDAARLRALVSERGPLERRALADVVTFAAGRGVAVKSAGQEEIRTTLRGLFTDQAAAEALAAGRLEKASGYGEVNLAAALGAMTADLTPASEQFPTPTPEHVAEEPEARLAPVEDLTEVRRKRLQEDLDKALQAEAAARHEAEVADATVAVSRARIERLVRELDQARTQHELAEQQAQRAATRATEASTHREDLELLLRNLS